MKVTFRNKKLERECTELDVGIRKYGLNMALKILERILEIENIGSIEQLIMFSIGRCHSLNGNRRGQFSMDLIQPYRLIFIKNETEIKVVKIIEITNYH